MNWKEYIAQLNVTRTNTSFHLNTPVPDNLLSTLKEQFSLVELPGELLQLYSQTNGIDETLGGQKISELVWPIERVMETNKSYRSNSDFKELYMSFDQLLFVADAGNGDMFGYSTLNGKFDRWDIFAWNHENDSRTWIAPDLKTFVEWWLNGAIKI